MPRARFLECLPLNLSLHCWVSQLNSAFTHNPSCPCPVSVITPWPKATWGEKAPFDWQIPIHHWERSGQELRQEPGAETKEEYCLKAGLAHFLKQPWPTCLGMVSPTVGWTLIRQPLTKKCPSNMPTANLMEAIPQLRFPLSKLTRTTEHSPIEKTCRKSHVTQLLRERGS